MEKEITKENPIKVLSYEQLVQLRNVISNKEIDSSFINKTSKIDEKPAKGFSVVVDDGVTPANPTGLTATAGIQFVFLQWTYNTETDMSHYEIWRNTTNNNATATKIAQTKANVFADESVIAGTAYFYWIKAVDHLGNVSGFNTTAGSSATPRNVGTIDVDDDAITAPKINVINLAAIKADLGNITAGTITMPTTGFIRGGQTAYNTGRGFFLGYDATAYKFSIGNPTGNRLTWNGAVLDIRGQLNADDIRTGTLTGRTVQTALTGRRIRISSATGLTDRVSFLDGNTEEGYLRLEQAGFNWEMSIGGLNGDMFTVGTSVAAGAPIYVSMPFFGGAGTGATGQADISGGSGNNARAIGLSWSGGGAPTFRLDLSGRGITRIGNSLIPQWDDDLGTVTNPWRNLRLSGNLFMQAGATIHTDKIDFATQTTPPPSPTVGMLYYGEGRLRCWNGIAWKVLSWT